MADKRFIAVCDILGFRDLVMNRGLEDLMAKELSLFRRLLAFSVMHGDVPDIPPELPVLRNQDKVGLVCFSDTILLYALDDDDLSCRNVLERVGWLLFTTMISTYPTRIRAGIAYGEFYADPTNELYVGPALVEAYELEQAQVWAGAALTERAAARLPDRISTGQRWQWWVCKYPAPLKSCARVSCSNLVVDWTQGNHKNFILEWSRSHPEPTPLERDADPGRYEKWVNTRRFHKEVCVTCFPGNRSRDPLKVM